MTTWWPFISSITIKNIVTPSRDSTILQDKSILVGAMFLRGLSASCLRCLLHDSSRSSSEPTRPRSYAPLLLKLWVVLFSAIQITRGQTSLKRFFNGNSSFIRFLQNPTMNGRPFRLDFNKLPERRTTCNHETTS